MKAASLWTLPPDGQPPGNLREASEPAHEALSDFVHGCATDSATRTIATAGLVLSLWQLRGSSLSEHLPSTLLVNASEAAPDPIDDFIQMLVHDKGRHEPKTNTDCPGVVITPEKAPRYMAQAIHERRKLGCNLDTDPFARRNAEAYEARYHAAMRAAHGSGWTRCYAQAWTEISGLLTDGTDGLIARLNDGSDRAAFLRDALEDPNKVRFPAGIGGRLEMVSKTLSVSGSLSGDLWDEQLVMRIIRLGLPVIFLPHTAGEPLVVNNAPALETFPVFWRKGVGLRTKIALEPPSTEWFDPHVADVRRRLHLLPGSGAYEFAILLLLRQLGDVCNKIAHFAGQNEKASSELVSALFWDLLTRAYHGVTLGVAALAWHGLGFDPGCPRERAMKALKDLRTKGPKSPSDILRSTHLKKDARDRLLMSLSAEDLIRIDGKTVTAMTFAGFVEALHTRPELPEADSYRVAVNGSSKATE